MHASVFSVVESSLPWPRIDYSAPFTAQHNFKIPIIGYVSGSSFPNVAEAMGECWNRLSANYGVVPAPKT